MVFEVLINKKNQEFMFQEKLEPFGENIGIS